MSTGIFRVHDRTVSSLLASDSLRGAVNASHFGQYGAFGETSQVNPARWSARYFVYEGLERALVASLGKATLSHDQAFL